MTTNFEIIGVNMVCVSSLNVYNDVCGICKNNVICECINCENDSLKNNCYGVIGTCNHAYHDHCIQKWCPEMENKKCPLCSKKWTAQKHKIITHSEKQKVA